MSHSNQEKLKRTLLDSRVDVQGGEKGGSVFGRETIKNMMRFLGAHAQTLKDAVAIGVGGTVGAFSGVASRLPETVNFINTMLNASSTNDPSFSPTMGGLVGAAAMAAAIGLDKWEDSSIAKKCAVSEEVTINGFTVKGDRELAEYIAEHGKEVVKSAFPGLSDNDADRVAERHFHKVLNGELEMDVASYREAMESQTQMAMEKNVSVDVDGYRQTMRERGDEPQMPSKNSLHEIKN